MNQYSNKKQSFKISSLIAMLTMVCIVCINSVQAQNVIPQVTLQNNGTTKTEYLITKNSTDQEIDAIKKALKEQFDVHLNVTKLKRNKENEIAKLTLKYTQKDRLGKYTDNSKESIKPLYVVVRKRKHGTANVVFRTPDASESDNNTENIAIENTTANPLYIVDGEKQSKDFNADSINANTIKSVTVLKGDNATDKYGNEGKNGVIEIVLLQ